MENSVQTPFPGHWDEGRAGLGHDPGIITRGCIALRRQRRIKSNRKKGGSAIEREKCQVHQPQE